jgi:heme-degrading monooxygenase HmoA
MAVLITADVPGQTKEGYEGVLAAVGPLLRNAKGFIAHGAAQTADGCRCFEIWETQEDATQFFAKCIQPNLQEGIKPQRSIMELHTLIKI